MTEQIFALLSAQPLVSIVLGFLLAGFLAFVFKGVITDYLRKKFDLYDRSEIRRAVLIADAEVTANDNLKIQAEGDSEILLKRVEENLKRI